MLIHRLLYRFDYPACYDIVDRPGSVLRIFDNVQKGFFTEIGEDQSKRELIGTFLNEGAGEFYRITVNPNSLVVDRETVQGLPYNSPFRNEKLEKLTRLTSEIFSEFQIKNINRAGLRCFAFGNLGDSTATKKAYFSLASRNLFEAIENVAGRPDDFALVYEGMSTDKLHYRFVTGPSFADEANKYLPRLHETFSKSREIDHAYDIDISEKNFSVTTETPSKWLMNASNTLGGCIGASEDVIKKILEKRNVH